MLIMLIMPSNTHFIINSLVELNSINEFLYTFNQLKFTKTE